MVRYYQSSQKMPLGGVVLMLLGGLLAAAGLALAYVYLIWYIPLVYFNICFTIILGGALGGVVHRLARAGHLRSMEGGSPAGAAGGAGHRIYAVGHVPDVGGGHDWRRH